MKFHCHHFKACHYAHSLLNYSLITEFVPVVVEPIQPTTAPDIVNPPMPNTPPPERPPPFLGTTEDNWATWPTTEDNWATWPTTEWPTDDEGEALQESAGKSFSRGYYVAIGLGVLLVIVIVAIVIGIIVYKMRQRRSQKGKGLKSWKPQLQQYA